jgi:hypothetical protein
MNKSDRDETLPFSAGQAPLEPICVPLGPDGKYIFPPRGPSRVYPGRPDAGYTDGSGNTVLLDFKVGGGRPQGPLPGYSPGEKPDRPPTVLERRLAARDLLRDNELVLVGGAMKLRRGRTP